MKYFFAFASGIILTMLVCKKKKKKRTQLIFTTFINHFQIPILRMQIELKTWVSTLFTLIDKETQEAIPDVVYSDTVLTSSDESVFVAEDIDSDGNVDVRPVGEGSATLNVKTKASYVNSLGKDVTTDEEANVQVDVTAPPPGANETDLVVTFSAPQPLP